MWEGDNILTTKGCSNFDMKDKQYDYSELSLKTIKDKRYRHVLLFLGWVWYLIMYFLTENLIPVEKCHVVHCRVDDMIPFVEQFVIVYCFWYVLLVFSIGYFFFYDVESFRGLQTFIIVTQVVAVIVYIIWPSVQLLRPSIFERNNAFTWILGIIYAADTPTGVCPSLHVAYSLGIASTWLKRKQSKISTKIFVTVSVVLICLSVNFVKQHSFVDVCAAIPVGILAEIIAFGKSYWINSKKREIV